MSKTPLNLPQLTYQECGQMHSIHLPPMEEWEQRNGKWCFAKTSATSGKKQVWVKQCVASDTQQQLLQKLQSSHCDFIPRIHCSEKYNGFTYYATEIVAGRELYSGLTEAPSFAANVFNSQQLLCEIIKSVMHVSHELNALGYYYLDLAAHNIMVDISNLNSWVIDLDSCCLLGDKLQSGKIYEGFTLILPKFVFPQQKLTIGTPLGSQTAVIGFSLVLARAHQFTKDGHLREAKDLLSKQLSRNGTLKNLTTCLTEGTETELKNFLCQNIPLTQLSKSIGRWRSSVTKSNSGDWEACLNVLNDLTESVFKISVYSKERQAVIQWVNKYRAIATGRDPFDVLDEWPLELDAIRNRNEFVVDGILVHDLVNKLQLARAALHSLTDLTNDWKLETNLSQKMQIARRICSREGQSLLSLLNSVNANTETLNNRCNSISQWLDDYEVVCNAMQKATNLEALGEYSEAIDLLEAFLPKWSDYRPLAELYDYLCTRLVPWISRDFRSQIKSAAAERRYQQVLVDLTLIPSGQSTDELRQEADNALKKARVYVSKGKHMLLKGMPSEARTAFLSALEEVTDCQEARVGLSRADLEETLSTQPSTVQSRAWRLWFRPRS